MTSLKPLLFVLSAALCASTSAAQNASYTFVGGSCTTGRISTHLGPVPIAVRGTPRLGGSFDVITEGSGTYPWGNRRIVYLLTGASNVIAGGVPLPFDIATMNPGAPFCGLLRTSGEGVLRVPNILDYSSTTAIRFAVPNSTTLLGVTFHQQVLSMEFSPFGTPNVSLALSAAGQGVIGF